MCGIAGYSAGPKSRIERTFTAQVLLAAIAERGADAVGYAHRGDGVGVTVVKQRSGASALLERIYVPQGASEVLLHVRDYTKGHPQISANNHPVRHGTVVGVHNGIIFNDDELMDAHGFERDEPGMTVDSEVIFALAEAFGSQPLAFEQVHGSMAAAWVDERERTAIHVARGVGRPLWLGLGRGEALFASTERALEIVERYCGLELEKREVPEGTLVTLADGAEVASERFRPQREFEEQPLPAVRAPREADLCRRWLDGLPGFAGA
jgi:glucosamine 6-phosphate synthetase-like amidotransferase/phosphosugar isomerase protein